MLKYNDAKIESPQVYVTIPEFLRRLRGKLNIIRSAASSVQRPREREEQKSKKVEKQVRKKEAYFGIRLVFVSKRWKRQENSRKISLSYAEVN